MQLMGRWIDRELRYINNRFYSNCILLTRNGSELSRLIQLETKCRKRICVSLTTYVALLSV